MKIKKKIFLCSMIVFISVCTLYAPALKNGFLITWDDPTYITDNPDVTGLTPQNINAAFTNTYVGNYAPLHIISYAFDYTLFGMNPVAFHAVNNIFHGINAVLVMILIFNISGNLGLALFSALIFALHPVQVESVAWITERKNILSTTFSLGSFLVYMNFLEKRLKASYIVSILLFSAALLFKSSVVILPVLICLYVFLYERRKLSSFTHVLPFFLLSAAAAVTAVITQEKSIVAYHGGSPYATALTMTTILVKYLKHFLFPLNLAPSYNPDIYNHISVQVVISLIILLAIVAVLWVRRNDRETLFWTGWAFLPLLPVLQIIPLVTIINDRYLYMPLIGLAPLSVKLINLAAGKRRWFVVILILFLMTPLTLSRIKLWRAGPALWLDAIESYPENLTSYIQLGAIYHKMGRLDDAYNAYQKVFSMAPENMELHQKYGALLLQMGRYREALTELKMVYDAGRRDEELISNLGYAYMDVGDVSSGIKYHLEVIGLNPRHANSIYGLAMGYEKLGDREMAAVYWQRFLDVAPPTNPWRENVEERLESVRKKL